MEENPYLEIEKANEKLKTCVLYVRGSRKELNIDNQLEALRKIVASRGHEIVKEYIETRSGLETPATRPVLREFLGSATTLQYDYVLFWKADRLTRSGGYDLLTYVKHLEHYKKRVFSYMEGELTTKTAFGEFMLYVIGFQAHMESENTSIRTKRAQARIRAELKLKAEGKLSEVRGKLGGVRKTELSDKEKAEADRLHALRYNYDDIVAYLQPDNPAITSWVIRRYFKEKKVGKG
jgi:DNA invertase Pin-like site-specific DNA recombinase